MPLLYFPNETSDYLHKHLEELANPDVRGIDLGITELQDYLLPLSGGDLGIILARPGHGKCLREGTKVLMFDGSLKVVEDVVTGDKVMGPDSKPRIVLGTTTGQDQMYEIQQNRGMNYVVNSQHILSLRRSKNEWNMKHGEIKNFPVEYVYENQATINNRWKGYKVAVDFPEQDLPIPAYFLGLWLGDGTTTNVNITTADVEVKDYLMEYADYLGQNYIERWIEGNAASTISITGSADEHILVADRIHGMLQNMGLLGHKHIPDIYLINSRGNRLQLLAGLIDSDGNLQGNNQYEIIQKLPELHEQIVFLSNSLGFRTTTGTKIINGTTYYRVRINGYIDQIPVQIKRKKDVVLSKRVDPTMTGFKIKKLGVETYYGFQVSGDGLFLLEDMTVTHNSSIMAHLVRVAAEDALEDDRYAPPLYVSNEMPVEELQLRQLSFYSNIDSRQIRFGKGENDWDDLHEQVEELEQVYPIIYVAHSLYAGGRRPRISIDLVENAVDEIIKQYGVPPRMIVIDYLQRMHTPDRDKRLALNDVIERAKDLALVHGIPVVLGSQASREVDTEKFPVPSMRHGKETGGLEEAADWVISAMRPIRYFDEGEAIPDSDKNIIVTPELYFIRVLKQRSGDAGRGAWCMFDPRISYLSDLELAYHTTGNPA